MQRNQINLLLDQLIIRIDVLQISSQALVAIAIIRYQYEIMKYLIDENNHFLNPMLVLFSIVPLLHCL